MPIPHEFFVGYHHALGGSGKRQFADGSFHTPSAKPSALTMPLEALICREKLKGNPVTRRP
jgi:hypothetical protein